MTQHLALLVEGMRRHRVAPAIIARVERLNPDYDIGQLPRGIHLGAPERDWLFRQRHIGKRAFIARFGREAWTSLRRHHRVRFGRRQFVSYDVVQTRAWEAWQGRPATDFVIVVEPDVFANDAARRCVAYAADDFLSRYFPDRR